MGINLVVVSVKVFALAVIVLQKMSRAKFCLHAHLVRMPFCHFVLLSYRFTCPLYCPFVHKALLAVYSYRKIVFQLECTRYVQNPDQALVYK